MTSAEQHYRSGSLKDAIAAATEAVRSAPADVAARSFLGEMLCFAGDLDRADLQLDAVSQQDPRTATGVALFRQLVRAERARQDFFAQGRLPEFLATPSAGIRLRLEASIRVREGALAEAAVLLEQAEAQRPHISGTCNGQSFGDFRDLDDLLAPVLEVLTANGKYYWVPFEQVELVEFDPPRHARDFLWRPARLSLRGAAAGQVYVAMLYAGSHAEADEQVQLGRVTEWHGGDGTPVRGAGHRICLVGDQDMPLVEINTVCLDATAATS
ncbi:MAG: type VI secretion system accessory protein TagJ [Planctomycetota bacterium]|nr:type VI secretion system accessory protein TagJ [Planctomycetota bacterium]